MGLLILCQKRGWIVTFSDSTIHFIDSLHNRGNLPLFEQTFKNIDDVLWKDAGCTSELDYTEQSSWILFLKYLDALERDKATEALLEGREYSYILEEPYRWERWAAPKTSTGQAGIHKPWMPDRNPRARRYLVP